jgi:NTP pyrophosphatase (non-canonical NTP hydrolase)
MRARAPLPARRQRGSNAVDFNALQQTLRHFAAEREWQAFHTPKNLAMALMVEAAELAEIFQWMTPEQSQAAHLDRVVQEQIGDEVADVLLYLLQLADHSGIDLKRAIGRKLQKNAKKHPPTRPGLPAGTGVESAPETHVLIDWENVQPSMADLRALVPDVTDVWVFHGPNQKRVASNYTAFGDRATLVPIARTGKNALDFHLSFYMGYIAARRPDARFVVLSNDKGYAPMLEHAADLGFAARAMGYSKGAAAAAAEGKAPRAGSRRGSGRKAEGKSDAKADAKQAGRQDGKQAGRQDGKKAGRPDGRGAEQKAPKAAASAAGQVAESSAEKSPSRRKRSRGGRGDGDVSAAVQAALEAIAASVSAPAPAPVPAPAPAPIPAPAPVPEPVPAVAAEPAKPASRKRAASKSRSAKGDTAGAAAAPPAPAPTEPASEPTSTRRRSSRRKDAAAAATPTEPAPAPVTPAPAAKSRARKTPAKRSADQAQAPAPTPTPTATATPTPTPAPARAPAPAPARSPKPAPAPPAPDAALDKDVRRVRQALAKSSGKPTKVKSLLATIRSLLGAEGGADADRVDAVLTRLVTSGAVSLDSKGGVRFQERPNAS